MAVVVQHNLFCGYTMLYIYIYYAIVFYIDNVPKCYVNQKQNVLHDCVFCRMNAVFIFTLEYRCIVA